MSDLIERLRAVDTDPIGCGLERRWYRNPDGPEAADQIAALAAEVERLKKFDAFEYVWTSFGPVAIGARKYYEKIAAQRDAAQQALAEAVEALRQIAGPHSCGCKPCYGHAERDAIADFARDALARLQETRDDPNPEKNDAE